MENLVAVAVEKNNICPHEIVVVTEVQPDFLPRATLAQAEGQMAILYSCEGLTPIGRCDDRAGGLTLDAIFICLAGYIRCLLAARDMLLDTRLLSSDPETGVFVFRDPGGSEIVKAVWGADTIADNRGKICRVARSLAEHERVIGAGISMERTMEIVRSENLSLNACLKAVECVHREWNHIVQGS